MGSVSAGGGSAGRRRGRGRGRGRGRSRARRGGCSRSSRGAATTTRCDGRGRAAGENIEPGEHIGGVLRDGVSDALRENALNMGAERLARIARLRVIRQAGSRCRAKTEYASPLLDLLLEVLGVESSITVQLVREKTGKGGRGRSDVRSSVPELNIRANAGVTRIAAIDALSLKEGLDSATCYIKQMLERLPTDPE